MRLDGTTQPRKATNLKIGFLSAVDMPAHEGAQAIVLKARMFKEAPADMTPMIKTAFTDALREKQYEKAAEEALCQMWELQLNSALREAAEDIAKNPDIIDKPAALRQAIDEYITTLHAAMVGSTVNKAAPTKTEDGKAYPASDFAYVPDPAKPSEWKLRLTSTPGGEPDPAIVGAAAAALGPGYRGNKVEIPEADRAAVVGRVRTAWAKANPDKKPEDMPEGIRKQQEADMADEKELAKLRALAAMTDVQKAHHAKLDAQGQAEFEAMSTDDRDAVVKALTVEDESFTDADGNTVTKSAAGSAYPTLKSLNDQLKKARDEMDMTLLVKQAETELKHLPGEVVAKAKVLKSIERMPQAERDALSAMLKSGDAACAPGFKPAANAGDGDGSDQDSMGKIMQKSRAIATEKGISMADAQVQFLNTPEGQELYAAHQKGE